MIQQQICFFCQCNNCGEFWLDDHSGIAGHIDQLDIDNEVNNDENWQSDGTTHYCKECWEIAGEDEVGNTIYKISSERKVEVKQAPDLTGLAKELKYYKNVIIKVIKDPSSDKSIQSIFKAYQKATGKSK